MKKDLLNIELRKEQLQSLMNEEIKLRYAIAREEEGWMFMSFRLEEVQKQIKNHEQIIKAVEDDNMAVVSYDAIPNHKFVLEGDSVVSFWELNNQKWNKLSDERWSDEKIIEEFVIE